MAHHLFVILACIDILGTVYAMETGEPRWSSVFALSAIALAILAVATKPERKRRP